MTLRMSFLYLRVYSYLCTFEHLKERESEREIKKEWREGVGERARQRECERQ